MIIWHLNIIWKQNTVHVRNLNLRILALFILVRILDVRLVDLTDVRFFRFTKLDRFGFLRVKKNLYTKWSSLVRKSQTERTKQPECPKFERLKCEPNFVWFSKQNVRISDIYCNSFAYNDLALLRWHLQLRLILLVWASDNLFHHVPLIIAHFSQLIEFSSKTTEFTAIESHSLKKICFNIMYFHPLLDWEPLVKSKVLNQPLLGVPTLI